MQRKLHKKTLIEKKNDTIFVKSVKHIIQQVKNNGLNL